jgi:hypothetical protein
VERLDLKPLQTDRSNISGLGSIRCALIESFQLCRNSSPFLIGFIVASHACWKLSMADSIAKAHSHSTHRTMIPDDAKTSTASAATLKTIKLTAIAISVLMVAGIAALMVLAAGKDEDIAGIVASALFVTLVSGVVATVAAVLEKRTQKTEDTRPAHQR